MKQKDIVLIIVVVFFGAIVSLLVTKTLFVNSKNKNLSAQKVEPIDSKFQQPDSTVFNGNAINPTQLIQIGDSTKSTPF